MKRLLIIIRDFLLGLSLMGLLTLIAYTVAQLCKDW